MILLLLVAVLFLPDAGNAETLLIRNATVHTLAGDPIKQARVISAAL